MSEASPIRVIGLEVGLFASNCYLVHRENRSDAVVIDPGDDAEAIVRTLRGRGLRPALYLLTHGHMDHIFGLAAVREAFPAPVAIHPLDASWAFTARNTMPPFYSRPPPPAPIEIHLFDGEDREDAGLSYRVLHTPGHSRGSVSFHFYNDDLLFSGDVLFRDSIGRTDLPGGDPAALFKSIRRLLELPDETRVFPGHGPETTIGRERRFNPFVAGA